MCAFLFSLYIFIPRQSGGPRTFFFTYQMREYLNATRRVQYDKWNEKSGLSRLGHFYVEPPVHDFQWLMKVACPIRGRVDGMVF